MSKQVGPERSRKIEVPKRFNLAAYDQCADWDLQDWYFGLAQRWKVQHKWRHACEFGSEEVVQRLVDEVVDLASQILESPLTQALPGEHLRRSEMCIRDQSAFDFLSAADEQYKEWARMYRDVVRMPFDISEHEGGGDHALWKDIRGNDAKVRNTPAWKVRQEVDVLPFDEVFIGVSLGATDEKLCVEFRDWLRKVRKETGIKTSIPQLQPKHFREWHKDRLLPYLDLTFWAESQRAKLSWVELGNALFPEQKYDGVSKEERVRKTTSLAAQKIIEEPFLHALKRQLNDPANV